MGHMYTLKGGTLVNRIWGETRSKRGEIVHDCAPKIII